MKQYLLNSSSCVLYFSLNSKYMKAIYITILFSIFSLSGYSTNDNNLRGNGIGFIENKGQIVDMNNQPRPDILFCGEGNGTKIYLRNTGISYVLAKSDVELFDKEESNPEHILNIIDKLKFNEFSLQGASASKFHRIDMDFIGANEAIEIIKENKVEGHLNYYLDHCTNGITKVGAYNKIIYKNIYNGIDIVYYGDKQTGLKYDFIIHPGADANQLQLHYDGTDGLEIAGNELIVKSSLGDIIENLPKVYQLISGKVIDISCAYTITEGEILKFNIGKYDKNYPLVIDPWITYCGGNGFDSSSGIATDINGNIIITGITESTNFPVSSGAFQTSVAPSVTGPNNGDVFIIKFDPNGNRLWATYYGGKYYDSGLGVTTDKVGNVLITGVTHSGTFPITAGALHTSNAGNSDAFVIKFDGNGTRLWATYYGGSFDDQGEDIKTDQSNNVIITGWTNSGNFPVSAIAFQSMFGGFNDAFAVKLDANGNLMWATYFGGSNSDFGFGLAIDGRDDIIISGYTASTNFPTSGSSLQLTLSGSIDAFVFKFSPNGNRLWSTYYGGSSIEYCMEIATDDLNNIVFTGYTYSTNFPVTTGAHQTVFGGGGCDIFIVKLTSNGNRLWSTFQGAGFAEVLPSCAIDRNNNIYIFGEWEDSPGTTPVFNCAYQKNFGGGQEDQYLTKYDKDGQWLCSTYLGGTAEDDLDIGRGGVVCFVDFIYFTANTFDTGYPVVNAFQSSYGGGGLLSSSDATVGKLCGINCGESSNNTISLGSNQIQNCIGTTVSFSSGATPCDTTSISYLWQFTGAVPSNSTDRNPRGIFYLNPGVYPVKLIVNTACGLDSLMQNVTITGPAPTVSLQGNPTICSGGSALLTVGGASTCTWSSSVGINDPTSAVVIASPSVTTTYTVSGTATNGCTFSLPVTVNVSQLNLTTSPNDTICFGESANLVASGAISYNWFPAIGLNATNVANVVATPVVSNTYVVTGTDGLGCSKSKQIEIIVNKLPIISLVSDKTICSGESILLEATGAESYRWSPATTLSASSGSSVVARPTSSTIYKVIATNISSGCIDSNNVTISVTPNSRPNTSIIYNCNKVTLKVFQEGANYLWNTNEQTSTIFVYEPGTYTVVTTKENCNKTDTLTVNDYPVSTVIWIPNTFTPNNDGLNDVFLPKGNEISEFDLKIFNRWGEMLFHTTDVNEGWDGYFNNQLAETDIYVYRIHYVSSCTEQAGEDVTGHIYLGR